MQEASCDCDVEGRGAGCYNLVGGVKEGAEFRPMFGEGWVPDVQERYLYGHFLI